MGFMWQQDTFEEPAGQENVCLSSTRHSGQASGLEVKTKEACLQQRVLASRESLSRGRACGKRGF